jgi:CRISPR-associated endonuclease Cas2
MRVLRLSNEKMYIVVTYDLTNNKARSKIVNILESYWFRVQKSVFEVELTKNQFEVMKKALIYWLEYARSKYADKQENNDSIKFYILSKVWEWNLDWRVDWLWEWYNQAYFEDVLIL